MPPLATWLEKERDLSTTIYAFVIGSLGTWDPQNSTALRNLHIGYKYTKLFKKLCVINAITKIGAIRTRQYMPL